MKRTWMPWLMALLIFISLPLSKVQADDGPTNGPTITKQSEPRKLR